MASETIQKAVSQWWLGHFEALQTDEEEPVDLDLLAGRLVKELQLLEVNHRMIAVGIGDETQNSIESASSALSRIWKETFIPACLAIEGNDGIVVSRRLLAVMVTIGRQLDLTEELIDIAKMASNATLESVRALGSHMLGHLYQADALIPRLTDKAISVRAAAIVASGVILRRKEHTELLEALLWNVWHEASVPNRVAALQALPASQLVWDHVIARLRDVKEKVRLAAVAMLRENIHSLQELSSTQFAEIVQSGIGGTGSHVGPRCQATKKATIELVCAHWMKLAKFNVLTLLQCIDVLAHEEEAEQVLRVVLHTVEDPHDTLATFSPPEKRAFQDCVSSHLVTLKEDSTGCTPEQFLLARVAASHHESYLSKIVPDMGVICDVFQLFSVKEGDQALFICLQLLQMATAVGMEEEGSRRRFTSLLQALLITSPEVTLPDPLIEASVKALMTLQNGTMETFDEIIGHLTTMGAEDSDSAPLCLFRILSILSIVLEEAKVTLAMRDFSRNVASIVEEAVSSPDDLLREAGVACLGKVGLFSDKDLVIRTFKPILLAVASNDEEALAVRSQAILALTDWALVFEEIMQASESGVSLSQILGALLRLDQLSVAAIAAEATAKLLFSGRLCEPSLIAQLLVLFFHPKAQSANTGNGGDVGSMARMQQWLSLFFPAYCLQSKLTRDAVLKAIEAVLMLGVTIKSFPLVKVVEYVCEVIAVAEEEATHDQDIDGDEANDKVDDQMALKIALQVAPFILHILVEEERFGKKIITLALLRNLCKLLGSLEVDGPAVDLFRLRDTLEELGMILTDPTSLRALNDLTQDLAQVPDDGPEETYPKGRESNASTITEHSVCREKENCVLAAEVHDKTERGSTRVSGRRDGLRTSSATENTVF